MNMTNLPGGLGCTVEADTLASFTGDAGLLGELEATLGTRGVVCIRTRQPLESPALAALEATLGPSSARGAPVPFAPGTDFAIDFSVPAKPDDGRPAKPNPIERVHIDPLHNGPAAYGVHATLAGRSRSPMRFVDMRAVYAALPETLRARLQGLQVQHTGRPTATGAPPPTTWLPLAARHPTSGETLLLLPFARSAPIDGLSPEASSELMAQLWQIVDHFPNVLEVPLEPNTLVVWDNILCTHDNPGYPRSEGRRVWFFNIVNQREIAAA